MNAQELLRMIQIRPFVPFEIQLSSGERYVIRSSECLLVGRNTSFIGIPANPEEPIFDDWVRVANLHITSISPLDSVTQ
jgi:hypothetical protein